MNIERLTIIAEWLEAGAARCIRKLIATGEVDWLGTRAAESSPASS